MHKSHFLCLLLIHQEVDGLALITEFALRVSNLRIDIDQIAHLLRDLGPNVYLRYSHHPHRTPNEVRWDCHDNSRSSYTQDGYAKGLLSSS